MSITLHEALICAMSQATDDRGLRLQGLEPGHALRLACAIDQHLREFGYKILPATLEALPFNDDPADQTLISVLTELGDTLKRIERHTERTARATIVALPKYKQESYRERGHWTDDEMARNAEQQAVELPPGEAP